MAASKAFFSLLLAFSLFVSGVLGAIRCEQLGPDTCAFAVSTDGYRCVLEKQGQGEDYSCITSGVEAGIGVAGWVESDECVAACGLDRRTLGISSDTLRNVRFLHSLCSPQCSKKCRNIHDLYFNVAAGEGIFLPQLCQANVRRRQMVETGGSSDSAPAPTSWTMNFGRKLIGDDAASAPSSTMGIDNDDDAAWAPVASTTMGTYNVDGAKEGLSLP